MEAIRINFVGLEICSLASSPASSPSGCAVCSAAARAVDELGLHVLALGDRGSSVLHGFEDRGCCGGAAYRIRPGPGPHVRSCCPGRVSRGGVVSELPSGTVTFLFTDLEGSTRLWERHPDAMRPALERHDALLRAAVEEHRGRVVKTTGDGLHAVFVTTRDALDAALAAQVALAEQAWGATGELRVRMGLHTGDADARDGDYYGPATNRAARVMAAAHGGQIVLSHATEEIVRDSLPEGIGLTDLGEHRLPDLARPERVFQVVAPRAAPRLPAAALARRPAGESPGSAHVVRRTRDRARRDRRRVARVAAGHRHRCRWGRQEPHRHPGRVRRPAPIPRRCVALRARHRAGRRRARPGGGGHVGRRPASRQHASTTASSTRCVRAS